MYGSGALLPGSDVPSRTRGWLKLWRVVGGWVIAKRVRSPSSLCPDGQALLEPVGAAAGTTPSVKTEKHFDAGHTAKRTHGRCEGLYDRLHML